MYLRYHLLRYLIFIILKKTILIDNIFSTTEKTFLAKTMKEMFLWYDIYRK